MKYNKGEWSESYLLLKVLEEGKIYAGNKLGTQNKSEYYPVLKVVDRENGVAYAVQHNTDYSTQYVEIFDLNDNLICGQIGKEKLTDITEETFQILKRGNRTFKVKILQDFFRNIGIENVIANNNLKEDIALKILDLKTGQNKEFSYSIKSFIGSKPTILNASKQTDFEFKIQKGTEKLTAEDILLINSINKTSDSKWLKKRMGYILDNYTVTFNKVCSSNFHKNIKLIDSSLDLILAELLLIFYSSTGISTIKSLLENLIESNPLEIERGDYRDTFYRKKVDDFINSAAFGMMPGTEWNGNYSVDGGLLIVLDDGNIVVYHIQYELDTLKEFLFNNTKLETPSHSRYSMSDIYLANGNYYFKLNLQIRMK